MPESCGAEESGQVDPLSLFPLVLHDEPAKYISATGQTIRIGTGIQQKV